MVQRGMVKEVLKEGEGNNIRNKEGVTRRKCVLSKGGFNTVRTRRMEEEMKQQRRSGLLGFNMNRMRNSRGVGASKRGGFSLSIGRKLKASAEEKGGEEAKGERTTHR